MRDRIIATTLEGTNGARQLGAPAVGRLTATPKPGTILGPGDVFAELRILRRNYDLVVPEGVHGVVRDVLVLPPCGVAYGEALLSVSREALAVQGLEGGEQSRSGEGEEDIPEGMIAVRSQTDGIFYSRPAPDEPPFVAEGTDIELGKVLGLVEVMKCFNQVKAPQAGRVTRVLVGDAGEVKLNQPLFFLEPR